MDACAPLPIPVELEEAFPVMLDRLRLYRAVHLPPSPQGVVLLTHGLGEHSSRYGHVIHTLTTAGIVVVRYDQRGHGRSDGVRGHAPSYESLLNDLSVMFQWTQGRFPQLPMVLYGHSLGGNIAANWILRRRNESARLCGAVLSSPWFRLTSPPSPFKTQVIKLLSQIWPGLPIPARFRPRRLMRNQEAIDAYVHDPLIHRRVSVRLVAQAYDAGLWALQHASKFPIPTFCLHGGADSITSPTATQEFSAAAPRSQMVLFPDLVHEPHNEPEWKEVVTQIRDWVLARMADSPVR